MTKKIITGVIAAILLVTIAVFAAEKAMERKYANKYCERPALSKVEGEQHEGLLDQLVEAYKANDREKMGEIINKMQERREKMGEFAKFNRWRQWAHRRMMGPGFAPNCGAMQGRQMGPGWGQGQQMPGQGLNQGCAMNGPCGNCCCAMRGPGSNQGGQMAEPRCGQGQAMRERGFGGCNNMMGNWGAMPGQNFGQIPCQQGSMGMGNCIPQQGGPAQMPGCGRGFQKQLAPGPGAENMWQQEWNMPRRERQTNVPPPEWGW